MGNLPKVSKKTLPIKKAKGRPTTKLCQAVVPGPLLEAARKEWLSRGLTTRQVIAWALKEYLQAVNPKALKAAQREIDVE